MLHKRMLKMFVKVRVLNGGNERRRQPVWIISTQIVREGPIGSINKRDEKAEHGRRRDN